MSDSQTSTTGCATPRPMAAQAAPNRKENTTIWSTSPRAMASMMLTGNGMLWKICCSPELVWGAMVASPGVLKLDANARLYEIYRAQSDEQRNGGDDLKV